MITHKMTVVRGVNISETDGWLHRTTVEMTFENLFESIKYCLDNFKVKIVLEARVVLNLTMALASTEKYLFIIIIYIFLSQNEYHIFKDNCIRFKNDVLTQIEKYESESCELKVPTGFDFDDCVEEDLET